MTSEVIKRQWDRLSIGQFVKERLTVDWEVIFVAVVWIGLFTALFIYGKHKRDEEIKKALPSKAGVSAVKTKGINNRH